MSLYSTILRTLIVALDIGKNVHPGLAARAGWFGCYRYDGRLVELTPCRVSLVLSQLILNTSNSIKLKTRQPSMPNL
jgi:hypothetical protein